MISMNDHNLAEFLYKLEKAEVLWDIDVATLQKLQPCIEQWERECRALMNALKRLDRTVKRRVEGLGYVD